MIKCNTCQETKQEEEFAFTKGKRRETCKKCAQKSNAYYTHPETFFNLFVGKNEWKHVYFEDTIVVGKTFQNLNNMTAVEWILIELQKNFPKEINNAYNANQLLFESLFQQAKAMEKEQIINAHLEGWSDAYDYLQDNGSKPARQAEQYYNETYK